MKSKKEIIVIISIILVSIVLVFLPMIINNVNNKNTDIEKIEESKMNSIIITVYGEITYKPINSINDDEIKNELSFEAKAGITYGEIINRINTYLTGYSIIDDTLTKRYYESSKIYIKSSNSKIEEIDDINIGKININLASVDELDDLPGIGIKRANRIIEYISVNGKLNNFSELKSLLGVSDEIIELIKEKAFI